MGSTDRLVADGAGPGSEVVQSTWTQRAKRPRTAGDVLRWIRVWWTFCLGVTVVVLFCLIALLAGSISPYAPDAQDSAESLKPVSAEHPFGTDEFGRDILSRILFGTRLTLIASAAAVTLATIVGVSLGLTAGFFGGTFDAITGRLVDALFAFPVILLAISVVAVMGPGETGTILAIAIASLPNFARVSRSAIIPEKEKEYVEAARAIGASSWYIIFRSLVPNLLGPLLVLISLGFAYAVLYEASLSFLGMGAQPPTPEWGVMLSGARSYLWESPSYSFFPGVSIFLMVFSLNLVGDGLRDITDPYRIRR